jgi:uncharacterized membrane protein
MTLQSVISSTSRALVLLLLLVVLAVVQHMQYSSSSCSNRSVRLLVVSALSAALVLEVLLHSATTVTVCAVKAAVFTNSVCQQSCDCMNARAELLLSTMCDQCSHCLY